MIITQVKPPNKYQRDARGAGPIQWVVRKGPGACQEFSMSTATDMIVDSVRPCQLAAILNQVMKMCVRREVYQLVISLVRCLPPPRDRSITVKDLKSGNFNSILYDFSMALKTLAISLYEVWAHGVCFAKLPFKFWIFRKFRRSEKWTTVGICTHMVVMFKCGNLWHNNYMCQCSRSIH